MTRPILIDLNSDEHNQGLLYWLFMVSFDRCNGHCNIIVLYLIQLIFFITEDINLHVFHIIAIINELKTIAKHFYCNLKCKLDGRKSIISIKVE